MTLELKSECMKKIRALADENRLKIIRKLIKNPSSVNNLSENLSLKHYNVSKHLKILEDAQLISHKKDGQKRIYSVAPEVSKNLTINKDKLMLPCCSFDFTKLTLNTRRL